MTPLETEKAIQTFKRRVLQLAADGDVSSDVVVAAMADTVGLAAAVLDRHTGTRDFDDRMGSFVARAKAAYEKHRDRSVVGCSPSAARVIRL